MRQGPNFRFSTFSALPKGSDSNILIHIIIQLNMKNHVLIKKYMLGVKKLNFPNLEHRIFVQMKREALGRNQFSQIPVKIYNGCKLGVFNIGFGTNLTVAATHDL